MADLARTSLGGLLEFDFANMRWMGVLQRIGLCYLLVWPSWDGFSRQFL